MATPNGHSASFPNTIYQEVKEWAARQEAIEKETKAPAPLNDAEQAFLKGFRRPPPVPSPAPAPSPSLLLDDGKDYVSLLCQYRLVDKDAFAYGIPGTSVQGSPRWTCALTLTETSVHEPSIDSFPAAGFGLDGGGNCPSFERKQEAKQCTLSPFATRKKPCPDPGVDAAKCAIQWLDSKSLFPSSLRSLAFPEEALPVLRDQPAKHPSEGSNGVLSPPPKRKIQETTGTADGAGYDVPAPKRATERVSTLCQSMGLTAPKYVITRAPTGNCIFNGYPDFGDDEYSFDFPEGLGHVEGVAGRDNTKLRMAEQLLPCIMKIYQERMGDHDSYLAAPRR